MTNSAALLKKRLQKLAEKRGFKAELARKTGISPTQIQEYVSGGMVPGLEVIDRLADALGLSTDELIKPEQKEVPPTIDPRDVLALAARALANTPPELLEALAVLSPESMEKVLTVAAMYARDERKAAEEIA